MDDQVVMTTLRGLLAAVRDAAGDGRPEVIENLAENMRWLLDDILGDAEFRVATESIRRALIRPGGHGKWPTGS